jgi:glucosamine-6-phosphate deaminase
VNAQSRTYQSKMYGKLRVQIFKNSTAMGKHAASDLASIISESIAKHNQASIILASANSQLQLMDALCLCEEINWKKVLIFHMDEYVGLTDKHPACFRRFIREKLADIVRPRAFFGIQGDAQDLEEEIKRYSALLKRFPVDACVMGIGENGHLAFNDPPADFITKEAIHVVTLDETCRQQQVREGHFTSVDLVPEKGITLTISALMAPKNLLVVVPEKHKALAVKTALEEPITPNCPASILRNQAHAKLYLDRESASLLA